MINVISTNNLNNKLRDMAGIPKPWGIYLPKYWLEVYTNISAGTDSIGDGVVELLVDFIYYNE
jgi:hypothetical protein